MRDETAHEWGTRTLMRRKEKRAFEHNLESPGPAVSDLAGSNTILQLTYAGTTWTLKVTVWTRLPHTAQSVIGTV